MTNYQEINTGNIQTCATAIRDFVGFNRAQAEVIYLFLLELGATKDIKFMHDAETGRIHIMKKFHYLSVLMPTPEDDGTRVGDQYYTLYDYIKLLIRFDRAAHKRMKNVKDKINRMYGAIEKLEKQL